MNIHYSNEYLVAKIGFDTAEIDPRLAEIYQVSTPRASPAKFGSQISQIKYVVLYSVDHMPNILQ